MQLGFSSTVFFSSLQERQKEKSSGSYKVLNGHTVLYIDGSDYLMFIPRRYFVFTNTLSPYIVTTGTNPIMPYFPSYQAPREDQDSGHPTPPRLLFLHTLYIPTLIPSPFPNFQNPLIVSSRHIIISKTSYFLNIVFAHSLPISCLNGSLFARSSVLTPGLTIYHWAELNSLEGEFSWVIVCGRQNNGPSVMSMS